jgi:hypothetical protein
MSDTPYRLSIENISIQPNMRGSILSMIQQSIQNGSNEFDTLKLQQERERFIINKI